MFNYQVKESEGINMKYKSCIKLCLSMLFVLGMTACSNEEINVVLAKNIQFEYGDKLEKAKLYNAKKSEKGLKLDKVKNFNSKKIGKQTVKATFTLGDKKVSKDIEIKIKDTKKPVIEVTKEEVIISVGENPDFNSLIKVSDPIDGTLKLGKKNKKGAYWIDDSKLDNTSPGSYEVIIKAMDINGLKADDKILKVTVVEGAVENNPESDTQNNNSANPNNTANNTAGKNNTSNSNSAGNNASNPNSNATVETPVVPKGPQPAIGTVIQANDFPNDGWHWVRNTYCWIPQTVSWGFNNELESITWQISPNTHSQYYQVLIMAKENARQYMPPAPTFEQSKTLVKDGNDDVTYGETTLYVYVGE